jgi:hypothetical protein
MLAFPPAFQCLTWNLFIFFISKLSCSFTEVEDNMIFSPEKLQKLGWTFRPLEKTLRDSVESYRASGVLNWASNYNWDKFGCLYLQILSDSCKQWNKISWWHNHQENHVTIEKINILCETYFHSDGRTCLSMNMLHVFTPVKICSLFSFQLDQHGIKIGHPELDE